MRREYFKYFFLTGCLLLVTFPANAQEVVHALCGTVRSIDSTNKTITVVTDNGTPALFKETKKPEVRLDFDKRIRAEVTAQEALPKQEPASLSITSVVVMCKRRLHCKILALGRSKRSAGTVVKFDRHERVLTAQENLGVESLFI